MGHRMMAPRGRVPVLFLGLAWLPVALADLPPVPDYPGFRLKYEDDFNYLNEGIWTRLDGYVQNAYVPPPGIPDLVCYKADDVWTDSGNLVLRTRRRDMTCQGTGGQWKNYQYTSGWVDTLGKLQVTNGKVEIRAKLPPPTFRTWPSAWTNSIYNARDTGLCWPIANEIDIYEVAGGFDAQGGLGANAMCSSYHYGYGCRDDLGQPQTGCIPAWEADFTQWHTYAVDWDNNGLTWYFDGRPYHYRNRGNAPAIRLPVDPQYLVIETALAWWIEPRDAPADLGPSGEALHFIDWVRVWERV